MCKCCQNCFETCYWNMIEERFCFDESIAAYEDPSAIKEEKNNNFCDNMAFYDSVAIIAGRAIVTIDPMPERQAIVQQPRSRLKRGDREEYKKKAKSQSSIHRIPSFVIDRPGDASDGSKADKEEEDIRTISPVKKTVSFEDISPKTAPADLKDKDRGSSEDLLEIPQHVELRRKSLMERRTSKSLHLKIDLPQEVPIIRQSSVPKFFVDTPEQNQTESSIFKTPLTSLQSPMVCYDGFCYDLKSVVQLECSKVNGTDYCVEVPQVHRESSSSNKLYQIKEKMKLKKSKSSVSHSSIPHSNYI